MVAAGDTMDEQRLNLLSAKQEVSFYIAANDQEILRQVTRLMAHNGYLGMTDTAGRVHYVVDGRKGTPYASRRILEAAGQLLLDQERTDYRVQGLVREAVDTVLNHYQIAPELNGYQYLRFMLLYVGTDQTRIKPITKKLYPLAAERFRVQISQVERDIRYALSKTTLKKMGLTASASFCRMQQDVTRRVDASQLALVHGPDRTKLSDPSGRTREPLPVCDR